MSKALRHDVGQLIIAGLEGPVLTATEKAWLKLIRPGGVILFRRNIEEARQTTQLLRDATEASGHNLFRCIDLEGGLVDRLRDLIASMPSAAAVFSTRKPSLYKKHGQLIGREARLLGLNTVFAPVLDLALPESSSVMRTRVVSPAAGEVIAYASEFLKGLAGEKVLGCGKHFPGLGAGTFDSHHTTPHIDRSGKVLWQEDLAPYRALSSQLPMVMVSHAVYPRTPGPKVPASISPYWVTSVLRRKIGYQGLIVSDDMEMGGILTQCSIEEAAIKAVAAGTHLIEICKDPALVLRAYEVLLTEAERSKAFSQKVREAAFHIRGKSRQLAIIPSTPSPERIDMCRKQVFLLANAVSQFAQA